MMVPEMNELPWGSALIPEWWGELTPHYTIDVEEVEEERRRELARIAVLEGRQPAEEVTKASAVEEDESLLVDTGAVGPYALPGFRAADGISDASFVGPGKKRWCITPEGHFYDPLFNPDVRYTAAQMAQSGHIPQGMEEEFGKGWDTTSRSSMSSPVDNSMYARSEGIAWQKPDWLKKKLRSTNQGTAIRHGKYPLETGDKTDHDDDDDKSNNNNNNNPGGHYFARTQSYSGRTAKAAAAATSSNSLNNSTNKMDKNSDLNASTWHGKSKQTQLTSTSSMLPWRQKKETAPAGNSWIKQKKEEETARTTPTASPISTLTTSPVLLKPEETPAAINNRSRSSNAPADEVKKEEPKPEIKKDAATKTFTNFFSAPAPAPAPAVEPIRPKLNLKAKAEIPTALQSVAAPAMEAPKDKVQQKIEEDTTKEAAIVANEEKEKEETTIMTSEDKKEDDSSEDEPTFTSKNSTISGTSSTLEEVDSLVSQGLVLKLMALPDDASRAKELRDKIAPTPENKGVVLVKPDELLVAVAFHAQNWKHDKSHKAKVDGLRQVAIIARLVIMKLYGSSSPELKHFEDGLRPAFAP